MSVKKTLILSAAAMLALGSTAVLAGGPDHMSAGRCGHVLRHGFYFGGNPSYSFADVKTTQTDVAQDVAARGWGLGVYAGWDTMATENFSIGAQAFLNFYDVKTSVDTDIATDDLDAETKLSYNYGIAIEPGYHPAHNVNLYARLGIANGHFEVTDTDSNASNNYNKFGWLAGLGSELALGHHVSARAQYTFYDYGKHTSGNLGVDTTPRYGEVSLGISYHL